ncbi:hypothetical protein HQ602_17365 [Rhodococcus kroppenstedtii]|uniref:hypothetical protein n=1 Tax=Rhodococcoides kroppenstedtii TaxID=293050 RepID=UPI001C9A5EB2|nr:hypothetical protein [Rhodococcus kroppenstedtii]MBY6438146.1 hypothetical protein [Rhodococcus kroppenstedtii]
MSDDDMQAQDHARRMEGRALYTGKSGELTFRPSVASYLDTLGTKAAVDSMTDADLTNQVKMLDDLNTTLHDGRWATLFQRMLTFSDSIALAVPYGEHADAAFQLGIVTSSIATYQFQLALTGRFLRGGVTVGNVYADYNHITGPALVEAVKLEQDVAVTPRVLLSQEALALAMRESVQAYGQRPHRSEFNSTLMIDADGKGFVNYLDTAEAAEAEDEGLAVDHLTAHRDVVAAALLKHSGAPRIREKYVWLAHYHNHFCITHRPDVTELQIADPHLDALERAFPRHFRSLFVPNL